MTDSVDLSLIIACYNEEPVIEKSVQEILSTLEHATFSYEIIFVDDDSHDHTREIIDAIVHQNPDKRLKRLFHEKNKGRGGTVMDGIQIACGTVVGFVDIDLEVHARYIPACVLAIQNGADIATGLRVYRFQLRSLDRFVLSKGYQWLARHLLGIKHITDTETGYKFFNRKRILPVLGECQDQRWFWDTEVMVRSALRGYRIVEIPVLFIRRYDKKSSVRAFRDAVDYLQRLVAFRRQLGRLKEPH